MSILHRGTHRERGLVSEINMLSDGSTSSRWVYLHVCVFSIHDFKAALCSQTSCDLGSQLAHHKLRIMTVSLVFTQNSVKTEVMELPERQQ